MSDKEQEKPKDGVASYAIVVELLHENGHNAAASFLYKFFAEGLGEKDAQALSWFVKRLSKIQL